MKKLLLSTLCLCSVTLVWSATIEPGSSEKRHKTDYETNWSHDQQQTYTVGASASGCSFVDSKTKASEDASLISHSSTGASAEKKITHTEVPNTSDFGFSVYGILAGSGSGAEVDWSATLQQKFFWLTPIEKIVAEGTSFTITANGATTSSLDWAVSGPGWSKDRRNTSGSITINKAFYDAYGISVPTGYNAPLAGLYNISAKTVEDKPRTATPAATVYVVSITHPAKNGLIEKWDDSEKKYDNQVIKGENLAISGIWAGASGGEWKVSKGTLANETNPSTIFTCNTAEKGIDLELLFELTDTTAVDSRIIDVYQDYIDLCRDNFGIGRSCNTGWKPLAKYNVAQSELPEQSQWNCHGSTAYFVDGNRGGFIDGNEVPSPVCNWPSSEKVNPDDSYWNSLILNRGDVVAFYSGDGTTLSPKILQHSHTSKGGATMYGANNEPVIIEGIFSDEGTWKWDECTSKQYYQNYNKLKRVKVFRKI